MLNKIVGNRILKTLQNYIEFDESKNFLLEIWNGRMHLRDIQIKQKNLKFIVIDGKIKNFEIKVPWKDFLNGHISINMNDAVIYLKLNENRMSLIERNKEQNNKKSNFGYFERKILEKIVFEIENLRLIYKNYTFYIKKCILNEDKECILSNISIFSITDNKKVFILHKFSAKGKIIQNVINLYIDSIKGCIQLDDIEKYIKEIAEIEKLISQIGDEEKSINNEIDISQLSVQESAIQPELKELLEVKSENKIINTDKRFNVRCAIDTLQFDILSKKFDERKRKKLKIKFYETFVEFDESLRFKSNVHSKLLSCNMEYKNLQFTINSFELNLFRLIRGLNIKFSKRNATKITFDSLKSRWSKFHLQNAKVICGDEFMYISNVKIDFLNRIVDVDQLKSEIDLCILFLNFKCIFDFVRTMKLNELSQLLDENKEIINQKKQKYQFNLIELKCNNFFQINNSQFVLNIEYTTSNTFNDYIFTYNIEYFRFFQYEFENYNSTYQLNVPFKFKDIRFEDFELKLMEISKNKIVLSNFHLFNNQISNFSFSDDFLQIKKVLLYYNFQNLIFIHNIKNIIYAASTDQIEYSKKLEKTQLKIFIEEIVYVHKKSFVLKNLLYEKENLQLQAKCENIIIGMNCDFSDPKINKISVNCTGNINDQTYKDIIVSFLHFVDVLQDILENPFERIQKNSELHVHVDYDVNLEGIVCDIENHCEKKNLNVISQIDIKLDKDQIYINTPEILATVNYLSKKQTDIAKISEINVLITKIDFGFNLNIKIPEIVNNIQVHDLLIIKEKFLLPQFDLIGTATNLEVMLQINQISGIITCQKNWKYFVKEFLLENSRMKFEVDFDDINARLNVKTQYDVVNTISLSSNNIIVSKEYDNLHEFSDLVKHLLIEFNTGFIPQRMSQFNFIFKDSEFYLMRNKSALQSDRSTIQSVPFLKVHIHKFIFFVPGTSSVTFQVDIFNPKKLDFDIFIEKTNITLSQTGEKTTLIAKNLNVNIQKETFKAFSFDYQDCLLRIENLMASTQVFFKACPKFRYDLNKNDKTLLESISDINEYGDDRIQEIPNVKQTKITLDPLKGMMVAKNFYSHSQDFTIKNDKICIDITEGRKYLLNQTFIFIQILNFHRLITFFNHIYFKNCLPYDLKILLGDDDIQDEEIILKDELSFNTTHLYLRITMNKRISAESFMFQKGVYTGDKTENVIMILEEKAIQIYDKVINIVSYVENYNGNLLYYVFFMPHSFIVNKTSITHNIAFKSDYLNKEFIFDSDEIIVNDCFEIDEQIYLIKPKQAHEGNCNEGVDFYISSRSTKDVPLLSFNYKKLALEVYGNLFPIINLYIITPKFKIMNKVQQNVFIDKISIPSGYHEMHIDCGILTIGSKTKFFDFRVMNILKEFDNKYLFSMETRNEIIDCGYELKIVDPQNVANMRKIFYLQKFIEIQYSFIIENETGYNIKVNDEYFENHKVYPIRMKNKNILTIEDKQIHLLKWPYFKIESSFYTVASRIISKQRIMKLCKSQAPIVIFNNTNVTICINKKNFITSNGSLEFLFDDFSEMAITVEYNDSKGKTRKLKRKIGQIVTLEEMKITSIQRGMREFIYVGNITESTNYRELINFKIENIIFALFEDEKEFINFYLRGFNLIKKIDLIENNHSFSFTLNGMQIDNQEHSPIFPIILNPVFPQFYYKNEKVVADQYFLAFNCEFDENKFSKKEKMEERVINYAFFAMHEFELNLEENVISRLVDWIPTSEEPSGSLFFHLLHISPINLRLSLRVGNKNKKIAEQLIGLLASNLSEVRLSFRALILTQFGYNNEVLINTYKMQLFSQIFSILGGIDMFGNISSLVEELSLGVHDLFYEPYVGLKQEDLLKFTTGVLKGGRNFATYFLKGITNTISKVGRTISRQSSNKTIEFYDNLEIDISKDVIENVVDGISGIITKPVKGAKTKGVSGFFKGVGSGISGVITKPIAGISDFAADINENIKISLQGIELRRVRYPRPKLEVYDLARAQAFYLFKIFKNKPLMSISDESRKKIKVSNEIFVNGDIGHINDIKVHLILTNKRLLLICREMTAHLNVFTEIQGGIKTDQWIINMNEQLIEEIKERKSEIIVN